jgi:hypothetical protein
VRAFDKLGVAPASACVAWADVAILTIDVVGDAGTQSLVIDRAVREVRRRAAAGLFAAGRLPACSPVDVPVPA